MDLSAFVVSLILGTDFSEKYRKSIPENLHLKRRLEEMKTVLRHLDFREPVTMADKEKP